MAIIKGTKLIDIFNNGEFITDDFYYLNKGNDTVTAGSGNDFISGEAGNDILHGGLGNDHMLGGDGNDSMDGGGGQDMMEGGDGNDTYEVDDVSDVVIEIDDTTAGGGTDLVRSSISYDLGALSNVENGTLFGNTAGLTLTGNELNNVLIDNTGADGVNTLDGGLGNDTMSNLNIDTSDFFLVNVAGDKVTSALGLNDTIVADLTWSLLVNSTGVEHLTLSAAAVAGATATGNAGANTLTANDLGNTLNGGGLNDTLIGGSGTDWLDGGTGDDDMTGGDGNDTYVVDAAGDVVNESAGEGNDTVRSSINYDLSVSAPEVENLTLTGALGTENLNGTGNALDNVIIGNNGNNILDGVSDSKGDFLFGMGGNDTIFVHSGNEVVDGGLGTDTVVSDIVGNVDLDNYTSAENLTVLVGAGASVTAYGTTGANIINGNDMGMTLHDGGFGAADKLNGGAGDDFFDVSNAGDVITDTGGNDTVIARNISFTLSGDIEDLTMQHYIYNYNGYDNNFAFTGKGNGGNNVITDNSFSDQAGSYNGRPTVNNILLGLGGDDTITNNFGTDSYYGAYGSTTVDGGTGADIMISTAENRTIFIVDDAGDTVDGSYTKYQGNYGYNDQIRSSISWDLNTNTTDVFHLTLTGAANIDGTGFLTEDNVIFGNDGNNILTGGDEDDYLFGGKGNDSLDGGNEDDGNYLYGGLGNDTFFVHSSDDYVNENFNEGTDTVVGDVSFDLSNFNNVENGTLSALAGVADITGNGGTNVLNGNGDDNVLDGGAGNDQMIGHDGNDTYVVDSGLDSVVEAFNEGLSDTVNASVNYTLGANVENLNLFGGNLNGTGNGLDNIINGTVGNNVLNGGAGMDIMTGNDGFDTFFVDNALDTAIGGVDTDLVNASVNWDLSDVARNTSIENLTLIGAAFNGTGDGSDNIITGNSLNNLLTGGSGADQLIGGTGQDVMVGGDGNDTYTVDDAGDTVTEVLGEGLADTVNASVNYVLGVGDVENLNLLGAAIFGTGNDLDNNINGNGLANTIAGGAGADVLTGGAGNDRLIGDDGNDTFNVDSTTDTVIETSLFDIDLVNSTATFTLSANVENLNLIGGAVINGTGNGLDNILNGNAFKNVLTGLGGNDTMNGGVGIADTMVGGLGDDIYFVNNLGDKTTELAGVGTGNDTVNSIVSHILGVNVEALILDNAGGVINGTGNLGVNTITGNTFANVLNGMAGADALIGGGGDDTFVVDNAGDNVTGGVNTDLIQSSITWNMNVNTSADVENLTLLGTTSIGGTGNALANIITGNNTGSNVLNGGDGNDTLLGFSGADTLNGGNDNDFLTGGLGHDILTGGAGIDTFIYNEVRPLNAANSDTITDFTGGGSGDVLDLSGILDGNVGGDLVAGGFVNLVQNGAHVNVLVDANGGGNGYVLVATLSNHLVTDFTDADAMVTAGNLIAL